MKKLVLVAAMASAVVSGEAMAACSNGGDSNQVTTLGALLTGRTVCVANGSGGWESQEFHQTGSGGAVIDWKLGSNAMDPTQTVGSWSVAGAGANNTVSYAYSGGGVYSYTVYKNGTGATATYSFCGGTPAEIVTTIKTGQGSCSSLPAIP